MTLLLIILLLAYYYFVLRKYNTLGFRLFSLCFFVSAAAVYWWWTDWKEMQLVEQKGISTMALVQKKEPDRVDVTFTDVAGKTLTRSCEGGMSVEELAEITPGQPTAIRYSPESDTFFLEKSYLRLSQDLNWVLLLPAFFLLTGILCWIFLRRYRIHPHEGTTYEYMTDETGKVVLDDARNETTKTFNKLNLISKLLQILGK